MSILIKGMEMPKNCYECLVRNQGFSGDGMKCGKTGSVLSWRDGQRKRMDNCPLVPVPSHGDLIDRDALEKDISESVVFSGRDKTEIYGANKIINRLHHAPTVIEADRGDDQ